MKLLIKLLLLPIKLPFVVVGIILSPLMATVDYIGFLCELLTKDVINFLPGSDIVTLETAKKLKANGFNKPTRHYYLDKSIPYCAKGLKRRDGKRRMNHNKYDEFIYSAPTKDELDS